MHHAQCKLVWMMNTTYLSRLMLCALLHERVSIMSDWFVECCTGLRSSWLASVTNPLGSSFTITTV